MDEYVPQTRHRSEPACEAFRDDAVFGEYAENVLVVFCGA